MLARSIFLFTALISLGFLGGPGHAQSQSLTCEPPNPYSVQSQSEEILSLVRPPIVYKSEEELDNYFFWYRNDCRDDAHQQFESEYKRYLKVAAEVFEVPYEILACKIFRESQFSKTVKNSRTGALGLGQFVPNTMKMVTTIISDSNLGDEKKLLLDSLQATKDGGEAFNRRQKEDFEYLSKKMKNQNHRERWESYFNRLRAMSTGKKKRSTYKTPGRFGPEGAKNPVVAIGATALYARYLLDNILGSDLPTNPIERQKYLIVMAGAYNMGPGNAIRLKKKYARDDDTPQAWIEALSRMPESKYHMESIKSCVESGNMEGPWVIKRGGVQRERICPKPPMRDKERSK